MNFARRLKEVVASNFIEIAKTEEESVPANKATPEIDRSAAPTYMDAPPPAPFPVAQPQTPVAVVEEDPAAKEDTVIVAEAPTVEPVVEEPVVPPTPAPVIPPPPVKRSLMEIVGPHDPVDLESILREANLPQIPFAAEQAAKVLAALPHDLPLQVKRLTVKATMEAVERGRTIEPQEIVADAMLKKGHLTNYREEFRGKVEALHRETDMEIVEIKSEIERELARLKSEIDRLNALKEAFNRKQRSVEQVSDERIAQMEQVIVFFQSEVARELDQQVAEHHKEDEEELPPFMRDDSVYRMLGMEANDSDSEETTDADSPETTFTGKRSRSPRRRFAVAENVDN